MPKKKTNAQGKAAEAQDVEDAKVEDAPAARSEADPSQQLSAKQIDAVPEEQKVDPELIQTSAVQDDDDVKKPIQRKNSRFNLTKEVDAESQEAPATLYRPEFGEPRQQEKMWELMSSYIGSDQRSIQRSIVNHVEYTLARTRFNFDDKGAY